MDKIRQLETDSGVSDSEPEDNMDFLEVIKKSKKRSDREKGNEKNQDVKNSVEEVGPLSENGANGIETSKSKPYTAREKKHAQRNYKVPRIPS